MRDQKSIIYKVNGTDDAVEIQFDVQGAGTAGTALSLNGASLGNFVHDFSKTVDKNKNLDRKRLTLVSEVAAPVDMNQNVVVNIVLTGGVSDHNETITKPASELPMSIYRTYRFFKQS